MDRDGPGSSEKYTDVEPPVHYPLIESVDRIVALNLEMQDDTKLANDVVKTLEN